MSANRVFIEGVGIPSERILYGITKRAVQNKSARGHYFWHHPESAPVVPEEVWLGTNVDHAYWHPTLAFSPEQLQQVNFSGLDIVLEPHDGGIKVGEVESAWLHEKNRNLAVLFSLDTSTKIGKHIVDAIRNGTLSGLSVQCRHHRGKENRWSGTTFQHFAICIEPYYGGCIGMTVKASGGESLPSSTVCPLRIVEQEELNKLTIQCTGNKSRLLQLFDSLASRRTSLPNGRPHKAKMSCGSSLLIKNSALTTMSGAEVAPTIAADSGVTAPQSTLSQSTAPQSASLQSASLQSASLQSAPLQSAPTGLPSTEIQLARELALLKQQLQAATTTLELEQAARSVEVAANAKLRQERVSMIEEKVKNMHPDLLQQISDSAELKGQIVELLQDPDKSATGNFVTQSCSGLLWKAAKERDEALNAKAAAVAEAEKLREQLIQSERHAQNVFGVHIERPTSAVDVSASAKHAPQPYKQRTLTRGAYDSNHSLLALFTPGKRERQPDAFAVADVLHPSEAPLQRPALDPAGGVNVSASAAAPPASQGPNPHASSMAEIMAQAVRNGLMSADY